MKPGRPQPDHHSGVSPCLFVKMPHQDGEDGAFGQVDDHVLHTNLESTWCRRFRPLLLPGDHFQVADHRIERCPKPASAERHWWFRPVPKGGLGLPEGFSRLGTLAARACLQTAAWAAQSGAAAVARLGWSLKRGARDGKSTVKSPIFPNCIRLLPIYPPADCWRYRRPGRRAQTERRPSCADHYHVHECVGAWPRLE